jgi:aminotransferase
MGSPELPPALKKVTPLARDDEGSPMLAMKKIMQDNPDIMNMAIGEANFDPPAALIETANRMLADRVNRKSLYTTTRGLTEARHAIGRFVERTLGATVDPEQNIIITVGGTEALHLAVKALVSPGDKVLLPDPGWGPCAVLMNRQKADIVFYELGKTPEGSWTVDADSILEKLDSATKLLVVNSPSNPCGAMLSAEGWIKVMEKAKAHDVLVISDEVYHTYSYIGAYPSALPLDPEFDNLLIINSFSKTLAIMGWRVGFALAHPWLIRQMDVYKETLSACTPSIPQWALAEYLDDSEEYLAWAYDLCYGNMEKAVARLDAIPGVSCSPPQGGFYLFPDFSGVEADSAVLAERILRGGVAVAMGGAFGRGGQGCARLLVSAYWDDIDKALTRIEKALT